MFFNIFSTLATFTSPETIRTNPQSMLWILPLVAAISIIYKTIKLQKITAAGFLKETVILFGSIIIFIIAAAVTLCLVAYLATE